MKQVFKITHHATGKIYVGKDLVGSARYFGSPNWQIVNADYAKLSEGARRSYSVHKEILWESATASNAETSVKEVEMIRKFDSNNPAIGYNRWPKYFPPNLDTPRRNVGTEQTVTRFTSLSEQQIAGG